jgi:hypothetical protein
VKSHPEKKDPGVLAILAIGTTSSTIGQLSSYPLGNFFTIFSNFSIFLQLGNFLTTILKSY